MNDDRATAAARVRCAEFILDRAHGKPAYLEDPNRDPDFVPLAERLKAYVRRDQILAAEGKVVQILPRQKVKGGCPALSHGRKDRHLSSGIYQ